MLSVEVINLTKDKINASKIADSAKKTIKKLYNLKKFPFLKNTDLSIVFLKPEKIRELNKKYRKKDKPTDILSFTLERSKNKLVGEILLCPAVIKTKSYSLPIIYPPEFSKKILEGLLAHGLLHLCGYDHKTEKEWEEMEGVEKILGC